MRLVKRGAEGDIYEAEWNGWPAVLKARKPKPYRNAALDSRIRAQRTVREAEMLREAKRAGVCTPAVFFVDEQACSIVMQRVRGTLVRSMQGKRLIAACGRLGSIAGAMHRGGMVHGDLTTSNFIASGSRICAIDFGLASKTRRPEDHAVDLRLFKEVLNSAHVSEMAPAWGAFLSGYSRAIGSPERYSRVTRLVEEIEARGRYARVV